MVGTTTGSTLEDGNCTESTSKIKVDQILGEKWKFIQSLHFPLSGANYNDELGLATVGQQISFDNKWLIHATTPYIPKIIKTKFIQNIGSRMDQIEAFIGYWLQVLDSDRILEFLIVQRGFN